MIKKEVYLAGSCKNVSIDERRVWRNNLMDILKNNSSSLIAFNPNTHFSYDKNNPNNEKLVMDFFLHRLSNCEICVFNLNNSNKSIGTGIEFGHALAKEKFIIGFGTENVYEYMREKCSVVFSDEYQVIDFLLEHWD